jgi:hypothetical protein
MWPHFICGPHRIYFLLASSTVIGEKSRTVIINVRKSLPASSLLRQVRAVIILSFSPIIDQRGWFGEEGGPSNPGSSWEGGDATTSSTGFNDVVFMLQGVDYFFSLLSFPYLVIIIFPIICNEWAATMLRFNSTWFYLLSFYYLNWFLGAGCSSSVDSRGRAENYPRHSRGVQCHCPPIEQEIRPG